MGFDCAWEVPQGVFRVAELMEGQCGGHSGRIDYSQSFLSYNSNIEKQSPLWKKRALFLSGLPF